jgi:hypothetical protein
MAPRTPLRKIHWRVPAIIILAFVAGLAFALGHHAFYGSLDGQPVDRHFFDQQINLAVGQAFAFVVRASLVISVGASYWQVFWGTMLHGTLAISQVDALAGMLGSILDLLNLKASTTRPILVALALLSWMVPLTSILPPATLSVHSTTRTEHEQLRLPIPQFDGMSMAILYTIGTSSNDGNMTVIADYKRPTRQLTRLVTVTAYRGAVPDHHTAFPNSTYTLHFQGPALRCEAVPEDLLHNFNEAMNCSFMPDKIDDGPKIACKNVANYLSWVPGIELGDGNIGSAVESSVPFKPNSMTDGNLPLEFRKFSKRDPRYIGGFRGEAASVYLATRSQRLPYDFANWDLLSCSMYNASYSVNVTSDSNSRGIFSKPEIRTLNSVPFVSELTRATNLLENLSFEKASANPTFAYLALMESLNRLIVGTMLGDDYFAKKFNTSYFHAEDITVQNQGFQQTLLSFTAELLPYQARLDSNWTVPDTRQWTKVDTLEDPFVPYTVSYPKEAFLSPTFNRSLASVVEELFHNLTLSLFSAETFISDSPEVVQVTRYFTQNTYAYDSRNLLISYGLAVSFALLAGIAGCTSIYSNGASYSNRFSTVLRTTRGQELEELVLHNDRTGFDPLPKHLEKARIDLRRGQVESERDIDVWRPENISEQTSMISILRSDGQAGVSS